MSLEFADFAHYYVDSGLTEVQQRENFEVYAAVMESVAQLFWNGEPGENRLGISFNLVAISPGSHVESEGSLKSMFNCAACPKTAGKKDS